MFIDQILNVLLLPFEILFLGVAFTLALYALLHISTAFSRYLTSNYLKAKGARLISFYWAPRGPGWLGRRELIYRIVYQDRDTNVHEAYCTTGLLAGVYFNDDKIVERPGAANGVEDDRVEADPRTRGTTPGLANAPTSPPSNSDSEPVRRSIAAQVGDRGSHSDRKLACSKCGAAITVGDATCVWCGQTLVA